MTRKPKRLNQAGQSTIEFVLTCSLMMAFIFFYLKLSLFLAWGNYAHYATFMSARAYLSAGPTQEDQRTRARSVAQQLLKRSEGNNLDRYPVVAKGFDKAGGGGDSGIVGYTDSNPEQNPAAPGPHERNSSWMEGVRYSFRGRLFAIPLGKPTTRGLASDTSPPDVLELTSESWLGREQTFEECLRTLEKSKDAILDNGC
ncbi:MAG: TadE/TadG family type IV pilus assembly protein [Bdellovibrionota bacterium]